MHIIRIKLIMENTMEHHRILPFYMAYPFPLLYQDEDTAMRDLEYIGQMYPQKAKRGQRRVAQMLDKMDYEGSLIYDEYPDKLQLLRLADMILETMKKDEDEDAMQDSDKELIQLILFYEIYRRRHDNRKGYLKF